MGRGRRRGAPYVVGPYFDHAAFSAPSSFPEELLPIEVADLIRNRVRNMTACC